MKMDLYRNDHFCHLVSGDFISKNFVCKEDLKDIIENVEDLDCNDYDYLYVLLLNTIKSLLEEGIE